MAARFLDRLPSPVVGVNVPQRPAIVPKVPVVGIGLPSGDMVHKSHMLSVGMMLQTQGVRLALLDSRSSMVTTGRNNVVKQARSMKCSHIMWVDSDMVFPAEALVRLLMHEKDIVGCIYHRRVPPYDLLGRQLPDEDGLKGEVAAKEIKTGLLEMAGLGTGFLLTKMDVFDKMKRPYFRFIDEEESEILPEGRTLGEDYYFCNTARALGFRIWCDIDLSYKVGHIGEWTFKPGMQTAMLPTGQAAHPNFLKNSAIDPSHKSSDRSEGTPKDVDSLASIPRAEAAD